MAEPCGGDIVQDRTPWEDEASRADFEVAVLGIGRGLQDAAAGRTRPAEQVFAEMRAMLAAGIQGKVR